MSITTGQVIELPPAGMFKVGNLLGSGGFGQVFVVNKMVRQGCEDIITPEVFALKVIKCNDDGAVALAMKEAQTQMNIKHENIVHLICPVIKRVGTHDTFVCLLTEYCSGGNLDYRLRHNPDPSTKRNWLYQLASAITHLHSHCPKIVHRDLKPANILLTANDVIKVADFGLARQYEALRQLGSSSAALQSYYMNSGVGTWAYRAPETFTGHYTEKADIFSLGVIFYAILEGSYGAFVNPNKSTPMPLGVAMHYSGNSKPQEELSFISTYKEHNIEEAKLLEALVRQCLLYESGRRPTAKEIRRMLENIQSNHSIQPSIHQDYSAFNSSTHPFQPSTHPFQPSTRPFQPSTHPFQPSTHPFQPSTNPSPPSTHPFQPPSIHPFQPSTHPFPPSTHPFQPSIYPLQRSTHPFQPSTHPSPPSTHPFQPPSIHPFQPSTHPFQPSTHPFQPSTHPLQRSIHAFQSSTHPLQR